MTLFQMIPLPGNIHPSLSLSLVVHWLCGGGAAEDEPWEFPMEKVFLSFVVVVGGVAELFCLECIQVVHQYTLAAPHSTTATKTITWTSAMSTDAT